MMGLPEPVRLPDEDEPTVESLTREVWLRNEWIRQNREQYRHATALATILLDLDRCVHGRHEGDPCFSCPGEISSGNPHMRPGSVIGYGLGGRKVIVPDREHKNDPAAWREGTEGS